MRRQPAPPVPGNTEWERFDSGVGIPKQDFKMIYEIWEEYCGGVMARSKISEETHNSTYVISILHWLDEHARLTK